MTNNCELTKIIEIEEFIDEASGKLTEHGRKHIESLVQGCIDKNYALGAIEFYNRSN